MALSVFSNARLAARARARVLLLRSMRSSMWSDMLSAYRSGGWRASIIHVAYR